MCASQLGIRRAQVNSERRVRCQTEFHSLWVASPLVGVAASSRVPSRIVEEKEAIHENETSMVCVSRLFDFNDRPGPDSLGELQPQPEFRRLPHLCLGKQQPNQVKDSILAQVAHQDLDSALQGKGLKLVQENENPDLIVTANGGMKEQTSYSAWGMRGIGGGMGGITPEQNVSGTLIVDLYETKSQSLIWRGIAQNALSNNGNKNQQLVAKAVQKMFKQWPAGS